MKKLFILFIFTFTTLFAFAEHTVSVMPTFTFGSFEHNIDNVRTSGNNTDISLSMEYLYVFDIGFSVGANFTGCFSDYFDTVPDSIINNSKDSLGSGISFAPAIGWTFDKSAYIQLILYPVIYQSIDYTSHTVTVGKVSKKYDETVTLTTIKTGIASSFEWGWEHFKLGFGVGGNIIFEDDYNKKMESSTGFELLTFGKFTFLF